MRKIVRYNMLENVFCLYYDENVMMLIIVWFEIRVIWKRKGVLGYKIDRKCNILNSGFVVDLIGLK